VSRLFDHVDVRVRDRRAATVFYDALMGALGATKREGPQYTTWRIPAQGEANERPGNFGIVQEDGLVAGSVRIALRAPSRDAVKAVAKILPSIGARNIEMDEGFYGDAYYGVFFEDPDGNRLEVCVDDTPLE
jgi:catechol 2,3-dioxygenase-like lactoylglutathione lyase family enzyme